MTVVAETNEPGGEVTAWSARLRHLIVTIYGLYARSDGGWLSIAALIRLLADLGIDEPAVRSAISRLKRRGILVARRQDGSAGYQLSAEALAILREGDARIFRRHRATLADGWLLAVFSVPESERQRRHVLRSELARLGFGMVAPGVWIVPAHPQDTTAETLRRLGLDSYADLFHAEHLAFGDPAEKIRRWWDLDELERRYQAFIQAHEPVVRRWEADAAGSVGSVGPFRPRGGARRSPITCACSPTGGGCPTPIRDCRPNCSRTVGSACARRRRSSRFGRCSRNRLGPTCGRSLAADRGDALDLDQRLG